MTATAAHLASDLDHPHHLQLTADEERALCADLRSLEDQLDLTLAALGLQPPAQAGLDARREARARTVRSLSGQGELARTARRLHRSIARLMWRLALSGMSQVTHQLRQRSYRRVSRDELRQAGVIGLHKAARRFEAGRGLRFSTYCRYWVRESMGEAVGRLEYVARLPGKARRQLRTDAARLPARQARALERVRSAVDLDAPLGDDTGRRRRDLLTGAPAKWNPERRTLRRRRLRRLENALAQSDLSDRDRFVLMHRYGLQGHERRSNLAIGEDLGVSGERVRQLEKRALKALRTTYEAA